MMKNREKEIEVILEQVPYRSKQVLHHLLQLYLYEFTEYCPDDVNDEGVFEYKYFDAYWEEPDRTPFFVRVNGTLAGFVLVNTHTYSYPEGEAHAIAEFFVMKQYRRKGVGKAAAFAVFDLFPGKWEVFETNTNVPAQQFWKSVISAYTADDYAVTMLDRAPWYGQVQTFDTTERRGE